MEDLIRLDHASVELAVHDRLLLVSDGVYGALDDRQIAALLAARGNAETDARRITTAALAAGSQDNARAIGRASGRDRVCQYMSISVVCGALQNKKAKIKKMTT